MTLKRLVNYKKRLRELLQHKQQLLQSQQVIRYAPHARQIAFHNAGKNRAERLFMAGNRCGKTLCGAVELSFHLTGKYPNWWQGRRFNKPVRAWAASVTAEVTRDILQQIYRQFLIGQ